MRWKKYSVEIDMTGTTRKAVAEVLNDIFENEYIFEDNGYYIEDKMNRIWSVLPSETIRAEKLNNDKIVGANHLYQMKLVTPFFYENDFEFLKSVIDELKNKDVITNNTTKMSVVLDLSNTENLEQYKTNLKNIYTSRKNMFQNALNIALNEMKDFINLYDKKVKFPIFKSTLNNDELLSCIQLSQTISNYAENTKNISEKINENPNQKFLMRTWLVRAGMIGAEYKFARKMFTQNLKGNSAWVNKVNVEEISNANIEETQEYLENKFDTEELQEYSEQDFNDEEPENYISMEM
ncbi:hypothetical protein B5E58_11325 [Tyzzerella sp. An114]|uniref:amidoligase family protein n=1 Tax=Tyzzerella sp. An114 TaxID=1965545 RepID=UPI000B43319E|nr:amidoligase family protein [Tyzzerella sp. An114]OUQ56121.1 hypothetical protein B5E58_11325 [Tyzzerella sp. An114]